jgi:hypothetical protein
MLELALRLDHITRTSEHLRLVDRGHLGRTVSVDLDLRVLTARQRAALAVRDTRWPRALPEDPGREMVWIPVARLSRGNLAPVTITDGTGAVVTRLTTHVTAEILIAGMARLLRLQVAARAASRAGHATDEVISVRARWLIERAMAHLIRHGYDVTVAPEPEPGQDPTLRAFREEAHRYLDDLPGDHAEELDWLLEIAVQEQLLIAMVPTGTAHPHLTYEAPLIPAERRVAPVGRRIRQFLWTGRDLTVTYRTQIPRIVRSYHLTVETAEEIHVRRFLLVTDADREAVENLIHDLGQLADAADGFSAQGGAVYRTELHDALARCAALARLRNADLVHYRQYLAREFRQFGDTPPEPDRSEHTAGQLIDDLCRGVAGTFWHLRSLAYHHEQGSLRPLADRPARELATALRTLADYLRDAEVAHDLSLDSDPRENGSHAYWANVELPFGPRPTGPVNARMHLDLADEPPALIGSVARMLGAILAVVVLLNVLLQASRTEAFDQADATVAVLLLVPGILLTRLDIPSAHSVLGVLRAYPRRIAHLSVGVTSLVAVAAASGYGHAIWFTRGAIPALTLLLLACWAQIAAHAVNRRSLAPRSSVVPAWLTETMGAPGRTTRRPADVHFDSIMANGDLAPERASRLNPLVHRLRRRLDHCLHRLHRPGPRPPAHGSHDRDALPGPPPAGHPVETVTAAARTAADRATGEAFTVTHRFPIAPDDEVSSPFSSATGPDDHDDALRTAHSSFGFSAFGSTIEVTTRIVNDPATLESREFIAGGKLRHRGRPGYASASGVTLVSSRYPNALRNVNEILFQLGTEPDLSWRQSLMLGHVLGALAGLAADTGAEPVSVHTPAASPAVPTSSEATELAGLSVGPFIRLGLSNSREHGDARIAFEVAACAFARELGIGVHLSEGRAGFDMRTWHPVIRFHQVRYQQARQAMFELAPTAAPAEQILLTLVGPASGETTRRLADLGRIVHRLGLGLHAASAWQVHQTTFLHLIMPRHATATALSLDDVHRDPIRFLTQQCATVPARNRAGGTLRWPNAYTVALADIAPLPHRPDTGDWMVPFWAAWDLPDGLTGIDRLNGYLVQAFQRMGCRAWISHVFAKRTRRDRWRGRAKISVQVPQWIRDGQTERLGTLAKRVQESVINVVIDELEAPAHAVNVHIAWGERWLGRPVDW